MAIIGRILSRSTSISPSDETEKRAKVSLDGAVDFTLKNKVKNGKFIVDQGIIAGCAGGGFENICAAHTLVGCSGCDGTGIHQSYGSDLAVLQLGAFTCNHYR